jgi:hypothetical protein
MGVTKESLTNQNEYFVVGSVAAILTPEVSDFNHLNIARENVVKFMYMKVISLYNLCHVITFDRRKAIEHFNLLIKRIILLFILSTMCLVTFCID